MMASRARCFSLQYGQPTYEDACGLLLALAVLLLTLFVAEADLAPPVPPPPPGGPCFVTACEHGTPVGFLGLGGCVCSAGYSGRCCDVASPPLLPPPWPRFGFAAAKLFLLAAALRRVARHAPGALRSINAWSRDANGDDELFLQLAPSDDGTIEALVFEWREAEQADGAALRSLTVPLSSICGQRVALGARRDAHRTAQVEVLAELTSCPSACSPELRAALAAVTSPAADSCEGGGLLSFSADTAAFAPLAAALKLAEGDAWPPNAQMPLEPSSAAALLRLPRCLYSSRHRSALVFLLEVVAPTLYLVWAGWQLYSNFDYVRELVASMWDKLEVLAGRFLHDRVQRVLESAQALGVALDRAFAQYTAALYRWLRPIAALLVPLHRSLLGLTTLLRGAGLALWAPLRALCASPVARSLLDAARRLGGMARRGAAAAAALGVAQRVLGQLGRTLGRLALPLTRSLSGVGGWLGRGWSWLAGLAGRLRSVARFPKTDGATSAAKRLLTDSVPKRLQQLRRAWGARHSDPATQGAAQIEVTAERSGATGEQSAAVPFSPFSPIRQIGAELAAAATAAEGRSPKGRPKRVPEADHRRIIGT